MRWWQYEEEEGAWESCLDYSSRGRALIVQQICEVSISSNSCFSFVASSKNCNNLWLKQQSRMQENSVLRFEKTGGVASFPYVLISSCSGSVSAVRCQHFKYKASVRL